MVRNPRITHCTQVNGIEMGQLFNAVFRHHFPVLQIIFTAPGEIGEIKGKRPIQLRCPVQHLDAFCQYFWADPVPGDHRNLVDFLFHTLFLLSTDFPISMDVIPLS